LEAVSGTAHINNLSWLNSTLFLPDDACFKFSVDEEASVVEQLTPLSFLVLWLNKDGNLSQSYKSLLRRDMLALLVGTF
jgi:hypothetical protein